MSIPDRRQEAATKGKVAGIPTARIIVALVIPLVIYFGYSAGQRALEVYQLNQEAADVKAETEALKADNARLRKQIDYLNSDAYVEKVAREELNLVKPGDKAVIVLAAEGQKGSENTASSAKSTPNSVPNWQKWWNFFFGAGRN